MSISMGAFIASGGMETLRYHAIAVDIGDVLMEEADQHTFFVDFRFRFISEQARTFFLNQYSGMTVVETSSDGMRGMHGVCHTPVYPIPKKLVSLMSDDPRSRNDDMTFRPVPSSTVVKPRSGVREEQPCSMHYYEEDPKCVSERNEGGHGERKSLVREKVVFLPDTMWIARTEALSTILRPGQDPTEPVANNARDDGAAVDKHRHPAGPSYLSDSTSEASGHTSCDVSDDEFAFVAPRQKRTSSLMETQDSVELTRNYWNKNRLQERSSYEKGF